MYVGVALTGQQACSFVSGKVVFYKQGSQTKWREARMEAAVGLTEFRGSNPVRTLSSVFFCMCDLFLYMCDHSLHRESHSVGRQAHILLAKGLRRQPQKNPGKNSDWPGLDHVSIPTSCCGVLPLVHWVLGAH